ncbi:diguanylate cyclase (GGDEF) domain-containing protein [Sphingomonas laterariae]|uniref:Diguanylate cyclase (GGDEF) domain-containing protein n=1 Tax=Edaphosphingomonas laterariae TaxID=861865 RepID=A0A239BV96_9SPHN|nr:EAL domain-containing protein [Sphingomonas laterariae]SNS10964.1 diguanylate cyclase (GGDEF) domain-containing protein [Sphingomonas laterariae]
MRHVLLKVPSFDLADSGSEATSRNRFVVDTEPNDPRIEALWRIAPWMAGLSVTCALVVLWGLSGRVPLLALGTWAGLIIAANFVIVRARRRAASFGSDELLRSSYWTVFEAAIHAGLWSALPLFAFSGQPAAVQMMLAGAMATMMAGAFLLALVPLAAAVWVLVLATAMLWGLHGADDLPVGIAMVLVTGYIAVVLTGCITIERLLTRFMDTAEKESERRESIALLLKEYEDQGAGWLWQIDAANQLTYVSPRISSLLGRSTAQLIGQSLPVVLGCDARLGGALVARQAFSGLQMDVETPGGTRSIAVAGSPIIAPDGSFHGFRGVGSDITEIRRSQDRLSHMARIDVLTGLPNRQHMHELFAEGVARAKATNQPCALMFLDLDGFKPVNDSFGHSLGDEVLRAMAQRLAAEVGARGRIGRVGGDEFALLLTDGQSRQSVEELGVKLIKAVAEPLALPSAEIRIGLSIGSAIAPIDGDAVDDLLLKADLALYEAKSRGRGTFVHFEPQLQQDADDRVRLEHDLRQALKRNEFEVHYQPVVSATTQAVMGFEALLRWRHPERGLISPAVFIPIAEDTGLIADIGEWTLRQACKHASQWPQHVHVAVNVSPRQLILPALPNAVSDALAAARLQPSRLELEVTESVFLSDTDGSLDVLRRVRSIGVGIALDDFGTGYSSLGYLNKTIFHALKIDGSFVRDAAKRSETVSIIHAIVALANSFRMSITAEGVETVADFERMRELGCHRIQGYLFGRPVPFEETLALVGQRFEYGDRAAG